MSQRRRGSTRLHWVWGLLQPRRSWRVLTLTLCCVVVVCAGKSTLLQVLAGKFMIKKEQLSVLGRPPFHDTALVCEGDLAYLGGSWRRDVAFAGNDVNLQGDITAGEMLYNGTRLLLSVSLPLPLSLSLPLPLSPSLSL
jgi:hypothetical protein